MSLLPTLNFNLNSFVCTTPPAILTSNTNPESGEIRLQPALQIRVGERAAAERGAAAAAAGPLAAPAPLAAAALRTRTFNTRSAAN